MNARITWRLNGHQLLKEEISEVKGDVMKRVGDAVLIPAGVITPDQPFLMSVEVEFSDER